MDTALGPAGVTSASSLHASPSGSPHAAHPLASREASSSSLAFLMEPVPSSPASKLYSVGELCPLQGDLCREKLVNVVMLWLVVCTTVMPPPQPPHPPTLLPASALGRPGLQGLPGHSARERAAAFMTSRLWEVKTVENLNFLGYCFAFLPHLVAHPF